MIGIFIISVIYGDLGFTVPFAITEFETGVSMISSCDITDYIEYLSEAALKGFSFLCTLFESTFPCLFMLILLPMIVISIILKMNQEFINLHLRGLYVIYGRFFSCRIESGIVLNVRRI